MARQNNPAHHGANNKDQRDDRNVAAENPAVDKAENAWHIDLAERAIWIGDGRGDFHPARNCLGQAAREHHHGQRCDEWLDAKPGSQAARNCPARHAEQPADRNRKPGGPTPMNAHQGKRYREQRQHASHREINPAADNYQGQSTSQNAEHRSLS